MGAHFGTIHVLTNDRNEVKRAVEGLDFERTKRFLIAPPIDGWVTVFPENNGQDDSISTALAEKLRDKTVICTLVHDDDIFVYSYFENGTLKDHYNSCPNYFDDKNRESRGGNAEVFAELLKDSKKIPKLQSLLDAERMTFEGERLEQFADLLNLPNAATAYEYLQDGERDGIQQWKQFIHVPDLTTERETKRAAKAQAKSELKRLAKDGLLIVEKTGPSTGHPLFPSSPMWCIDPTTGDVLLSWNGSPVGEAESTRLYRVNSRTGEEVSTSVEISNHAHSMAIDPFGKFLAVGCASGDWKLELWNLANGKSAATIPQSRAVEALCFSPNGDTLYSFSQGTVTSINMAAPNEFESVHLSGGGQAMLAHPGGEHLVVEVQGMLTVIQLPALKFLKTVWILDKPGPTRSLLEQSGPQIAKKFEKTLEAHLSAQQLAEYQARNARHFLPKQNLRSLVFSPSGNHLVCGTSAGVCVLKWEDILDAADTSAVKPAAFVEAESMTSEDGMPSPQLIYAVPLDDKKERVLFSGLEGKIRYWNLREGKTGDLLVPPFRWPLWQLQLTPDRSTLVATAVHLRLRGKQEPPRFQLWSYPALCQASGLDF
jgi:WD40 repeat protein